MVKGLWKEVFWVSNKYIVTINDLFLLQQVLMGNPWLQVMLVMWYLMSCLFMDILITWVHERCKTHRAFIQFMSLYLFPPPRVEIIVKPVPYSYMVNSPFQVQQCFCSWIIFRSSKTVFGIDFRIQVRNKLKNVTVLCFTISTLNRLFHVLRHLAHEWALLFKILCNYVVWYISDGGFTVLLGGGR
jgi:hypothetical protein